MLPRNRPAGPQLALPAVYTLSNAAAGNEIAAFTRASNGNLSRKGRFATGGTGSGSGAGSQGAIVFDARSQRLFAVNLGDNTVSMLAIAGDGTLTALSTVASGGVRCSSSRSTPTAASPRARRSPACRRRRPGSRRADHVTARSRSPTARR